MNTPRLLISEDVVSEMKTTAAASHPVETGGVLIGVFVDGQPWVTHAVEIPSVDRGRNHYRIPGGATRPAVKTARDADGRLGYLGDWHSHPADSGPSTTDLASLAFISYRRPRRPNPTTIVVRRRDDDYILDARRIVGVHTRACEIRLAGNLTPAAGDTE